MTKQRPKRTSAEVFAGLPHLRQPTHQISRGIFVRFLSVVVGVNLLVGTGVIVYDVADYVRTTQDHLTETANSFARVATELRRREPRQTDEQVVKRASELTHAPMALLGRQSGTVRYATAPLIRDKFKLVYDGKPVRGTQIRIEEQLSWLSGAWNIVSFNEQHDLLVISLRHPEEEGRAQYMTVAAGIIGLGLLLSFFSMLAAANWILKRPLHDLVESVTEALKDQLAFRNNLLDASESLGIVAADSMDHIQIYNHAAKRILGYSNEEVRGKMTLEGLRQQSHGPVDSTMDRLPSLVHPREGEEVWLDSEGREHLLDVSSNPIMDNEGTFKGRLVTFIDITDRRRLESELHLSELQLLQSAKMATLGEMATGVAHELNQPLNNIGLLASRMVMKLPKLELEADHREFYRDRLSKVRKQVERASKIIDHLRTFGRPSGMELASLGVPDVLHGVVDLLGEQLEAHGIQVQLDLPGELPPAIADEGQLEQVVLNLLVNARDALDALPAEDDRPRRIKLGAKRCRQPKSGEPAVCVYVEDNGCGIPSEELERIFDPFFSTKEVGKGTGLGLSISYGLVRGFEGQLEVQSEVGRGSTFTIRLKSS